MTTTETLPVLVVGAGPTGLTAANLLGDFGIQTVLVEAKPTVNRRPRSTFVDDEFFRVLGTLGLADEIRRQSLGPATYEHYSPLGFLLSREEGQITSHNYPTRSAIFQPWLDQTLLDGVRRFGSVEVLLGHQLKSFTEDGGGVEVTLSTTEGQELRRRFSYVLAADGARSPVREALGIPFEAVTPLEARSLRIDTVGDPDTTLVMRSRPTFKRHGASFPSPNGRRYSFSVLPGEDAETLLSEESLRKLVTPFSDFSRLRVINKVVYTFRTRVAAKFRAGRVFLLGDAAHVQPPAGSQGMNGGARDANNLAWKIAAVVRGIANASILDSYEAERYQAARTLVANSGDGAARGRRKRSVLSIAVRDIIEKLRLIVKRPSLAETLASASHVHTGQATHVREGVVLNPSATVGRVVPNPWVDTGERAVMLDSLLGKEFSLLGLGVPEHATGGLSNPVWKTIRARTVVLQRESVVDSRLDALWSAHAGQWLIVRPDRIVAAIAAPGDLERVANELGRLLGCPTQRIVAAA